MNIRPQVVKACALTKCEKCRKRKDGKKVKSLMRCSRCMSVCYCSAACQKAGWADHKDTCKVVKAELAKQQDEGGDAGPPLLIGIARHERAFNYGTLLQTVIGGFERIVEPGLLDTDSCRLVSMDMMGKNIKALKMQEMVDPRVVGQSLGLMYVQVDPKDSLKYKDLTEHASVKDTVRTIQSCTAVTRRLNPQHHCHHRRQTPL